MTFQDIFKEDGLYVGNGFREGFSFSVKKGTLSTVQFKDERDMNPTVESKVFIYDGLFTKTYKKILVRGQLFT